MEMGVVDEAAVLIAEEELIIPRVQAEGGAGGRSAGGVVWPDLFFGRRGKEYIRYRRFSADEHR